MKVNNVTKWIVINHQQSPLFNVIKGGEKNKNVERNKWLSLMDDSRLQQHCNKKGFNINSLSSDSNAHLKVRIGIIANNEDNCDSCESCIGFGTLVRGCDGEIRKTTCGNIGICGQLDNKNTAAFGYIFVQ